MSYMCLSFMEIKKNSLWKNQIFGCFHVLEGIEQRSVPDKTSVRVRMSIIYL